MTIGDYGVAFDGGTQFICLHSDPKMGRWFVIKGLRQEVTVRVTKSGLLRVGKTVKASPLSIYAEPVVESQR